MKDMNEEDRRTQIENFGARTAYASRFGGSQNAMAVMWGDKHRVGAARGNRLGECPRANKCWSMVFFLAGNGVRQGLWVFVWSGVDHPSSGPAARTWSNN